MTDKLTLSCSPVAEDCAQVGTENYMERARKECKVFIRQLRRQLGEEPFGARLCITSNPHDFGSYLEVAVKFDDSNEEATEYAFMLEEKLPEYWDDEAKAELNLVVPKGV